MENMKVSVWDKENTVMPQFYTSIELQVLLLSAMGIFYFLWQPSQAAVKDATSHLVVAKEGTAAHLFSLIWYRYCKNEQYVYFDASMGEIEEVLFCWRQGKWRS